MNTIYDVVLVQHRHNPNPDVIAFYDEDRNEALKFMQKYVKQNGFTSYNKDGKQYTIGTVALRERTSTGKFISQRPYHELFDTLNDEPLEWRRKKNVNS